MPIIAINVVTGTKKDEIITTENNAQKGILATARKDDRKKTYSFNIEKEPSSAWNWINQEAEKAGKRNKDIQVFAYDHNYAFNCYGKNHYTAENLIKVCHNPFIFQINTKNGQAKLLDIASFYPTKTIEQVSKLIEQPIQEKPSNGTYEDLRTYSEQHNRLVLKSVQAIKNGLSKLGYGPKKLLSPASISMKLFMKYCTQQQYTSRTGNKLPYSAYIWRKGQIHKTKYPEKHAQAARAGRIEDYTPDTRVYKNCTRIDMNSAYWAACINNTFPDMMTERLIEKPHESILKTHGISKATIITPKNKLPLLPIRNGKTYFLEGRTLTGCWTNIELQKAIENNHELVELHETLTYKPLPFDIFKKYYTDLYELKQKTQGELKHVVKLMGNSLTGRWAIKTADPTKQKEINIKDLLGYKSWEITAHINPSTVIIQNKKNRTYRNNPIIYSYITAYNRIKLWEDMKKIPRQDLLYCSTDCIIYKGKHDEKFDIGNKIGQYKIEKKADAQFGQEQTYRMGKDLKISGYTGNQIKDLREVSKIEHYKMTSLKQALKTGKPETAGTYKKVSFTSKNIPKHRDHQPMYIDETQQDIKDIINEIKTW